MRNTIGWILATLAFGLFLPPVLSACNTGQVSEDDIKRCCACLDENTCLTEATSQGMCRIDLTEENTTSYDADCGTEYCGRECDFLSW